MQCLGVHHVHWREPAQSCSCPGDSPVIKSSFTLLYVNPIKASVLLARCGGGIPLVWTERTFVPALPRKSHTGDRSSQSTGTLQTQRARCPGNTHSAIGSQVEEKPVGGEGAEENENLCHGGPQGLLHDRVPTSIEMEGRVFVLGAVKEKP